ncbi:MAG: phosphotransferase [Coriobacteriia bacterium]|nr:phosphotransferase [Coriobacteriia bacterium]
MKTPQKKMLVCRLIAQSSEDTPLCSQRQIAQALDISLGQANQLITSLSEQGLVQHTKGRYLLTVSGQTYLDQFKVDNAIILTAGFGSRFVPFTYDTPKGLLKVNGQPMIERQIEQLHAAGITDITLVVGYLKEKFDYLIDKYGVKLVLNPEYAVKNNFVSVYYALDQLKSTYVLASDHWIKEGIFNPWEPTSWLSCSYYEGPTTEWGITTGAHGRIVRIDTTGEDVWALNGPAYFSKEFSQRFAELIQEAYLNPQADDFYWEDILKDNLEELEIYPNQQAPGNIFEFENLEELRGFDASYRQETDNATMQKIAEVFAVPQDEITGIRPIKEGMTNQSFVFQVKGSEYVFRLPGAGTGDLIDRSSEKRSYELVAPLNIADEIVFFDGDSGIKISRFYQGANVVDADSDTELKRAMELLAKIHQAGIAAEHRFDIAERIDFYEGLAQGINAIHFSDYSEVRLKANVLLKLREQLAIPEVLCHIDYIYANVLWLPDNGVRVIDWEYSGAADPIIDIAMFSIYSYFPRERADLALTYYLGRTPQRQEEARLYMYIALAGFLWSIWCEYKQGLGEDFGEYPLVQYRYMKDFYRILKDGGYLDEFSIGA